MSKINTLAAALSAGLLLVACGGGSTAPDPMAPLAQEPTEVPASASASTGAYIAFAASLASSETREPLDVMKALPPTSETDEPLPIR